MVAKEVRLIAQTMVVNEHFLMILKEPDIEYDDFRLDGWDLRVKSLDGTIAYDFFVEQWNRTGETYVWVKLPTIGTIAFRIEYGVETTNASMPWTGYFCALGASGWTNESGWNDKYLMGSATEGLTGGSSGTHIHTWNTLTIQPLNHIDDSSTGTTVCQQTLSSHNHGTSTADFYAASVLYPYFKRMLGKYTQGLIPILLPLNLIAFFTQSPPTGWSGITTNLLMMPSSMTDSNVGASHTHGHENTYNTVAPNKTGGGPEMVLGIGSHGHAIVTSAVTPIPPYLDFIIASVTTPVSFTKNTKAVFPFLSSLPPLGWDRFSALDGKFIRSAGTYGGTGGSNTHIHSASSPGVSADVTAGYYGGGNKRQDNEAHWFAGAMGPGDNVPAYKTMLFGARKVSQEQDGIYEVIPPVLADFSGTPRKGNPIIGSMPSSGRLLYTDMETLRTGKLRNFDDDTGNTDGTLVNTTSMAGKVGQALNFDGSTSYVQFPKRDFIFGQPFTITMWIFPDNLTGEHTLLCNDPNNWLFMTTGNKLNLLLADTGRLYHKQWDSSVTLISGVWQFVTVTYDGTDTSTSVKLYINNVEGTTLIVNHAGFTTSATKMVMGARGDYSVKFDGGMDEVYLFNRVITTDERTKLYTLPQLYEFTVVFTDQSTGVPTAWDWDYGDLTTHGTTQNPSHTYTTIGYFTVKLTVSNTMNNSTLTRMAYIQVTQLPPSFNIQVTPETGISPLTVYCEVTDISYGPGTYSWDWGDNTTPGSGVTPTHIYTALGIYQILCTGTNNFGSITVSAMVIVTTKIAGFKFILNGKDITDAVSKGNIDHAFGTTSTSGKITATKKLVDEITSCEEGDPVEVYRYYRVLDIVGDYLGKPLGELALGEATAGYTDTYATQHVFSGIIKNLETTKGRYSINLEDYLTRLTKYNLNKNYGSPVTPVLVTDILTSIVEDECGLRLIVEPSTATLQGFKCQNRQAYEACQALCNAMYWQMYYDPRDNKVHIGRLTPTVRAVIFDTDDNVAKTPKWNKDLSSMTNNVTVTGKVVTMTQTEAFTLTADGPTSFILLHKVKEWVYAKYIATPIVTLTNGTDYTVSEVDDTDTLEKKGMFYIYHNPVVGHGTNPLIGDVYQVQYTYDVANSANATDAESMETYENRAVVLRRTDLETLEDLQSAANAYLEIHKDPIDQIDLEAFISALKLFWVGDKCDMVDTIRPMTLADLVVIRWTIAYPNPLDKVQIGVLQPLTADYLKGLSERLRSLEQS